MIRELPKVVHRVPPAGRRKPSGQTVFDTAPTFLTLILHVNDHCNYNKHDLEYNIPPEDTLHFMMSYIEGYITASVLWARPSIRTSIHTFLA